MEDLKLIKTFLKKNGKLVDKKQIVIIIVLSIVTVLINVWLPLFTRKIIDDGLLQRNIKVITYTCIQLLLIFIIYEVVGLFRERIRLNLYLTLKRDVEKSIVESIWRGKYLYFNNKKGAEIIVNLQYDSENIASIFDEEVLFVFANLFNIIGGCIGLALINWKMMFGILFFIPIKVILVLSFSSVNKRNVDKYLSEIEEISSFEEDSIDGIKELKVYGLYKLFDTCIEKKLCNRIKSERKLRFLPQINAAMDQTLAQLCVLFVYFVGGISMLQSEMTIGSIMAFVTYSAYVVGPIETILNIKYKFSGIIPSLERFNEIKNNSKEENKGKIILDKGNKLKIEVQNISFSYDKKTDVFKDLNVCFSREGAYWIKGENGKGKTTFINLIMRLLESDEGSIKINERNIEEYELDSFRSQIAYVGQEPFLFKGSIYNNITMYREMPRERVFEVCKLCGIDELVKNKTFDYDVGSNGKNLSGGQRQRIALARAILTDRKILVLDEATSNLDKKSKETFCELIKRIKKEKMILIITHDEDITKVIDKHIYI